MTNRNGAASNYFTPVTHLFSAIYRGSIFSPLMTIDRKTPMLSVPSNPNFWQVIHPGGRSGQLSLALKRLKELASLGVGHGSISGGSYGHIMGIWSTSHEFWAPKKVAKRKGNGTPAIPKNPGWPFFSKFWPDGNLRGPKPTLPIPPSPSKNPPAKTVNLGRGDNPNYSLEPTWHHPAC